jgi:hypothetical protein
VAASEPVDALGVATKTIEGTGAGLAIALLRAPAARPGDLTLAYFGLTFVLGFTVAASTGH